MPVTRRLEFRYLTRFAALLPLFLAEAAFATGTGAAVDCNPGQAVTADLGDGVIMHTCLWQKSATETIRVGPLLLIKNGIPILSARTNLDGQLHGRFVSWDDDGGVTIRGTYSEGRKQGAWLVVDEQGRRTTLLYVDGRLLGR